MEQYEVALSFADPQRAYAERVARFLQARGVAVFYDEFEETALWGKDASEAFREVYGERASYVVMFISRDYVARVWPRHERRSALSRALQEPREFILPVRFDDTDVPGLPSTVIYQSALEKSPSEIAAMICEKIGLSPSAGKADAVPPPRMTSPTGEAAFDYSSHNGRYVIGSGSLEFETAWTKASDTQIHLYNDPPSIRGVAIARGCRSIEEVVGASGLDYTSRARTVPRGGVAVLQNVHGFYAALHVIDIKDDTRADERDELRFRYAIQVDGSDDFTAFASERPISKATPPVDHRRTGAHLADVAEGASVMTDGAGTPFVFVLQRGDDYVANVRPVAWTEDLAAAQLFESASEAGRALDNVKPQVVQRVEIRKIPRSAAATERDTASST